MCASKEPIELYSTFLGGQDHCITAMNLELKDTLPETNIPGHECHVVQLAVESCRNKNYRGSSKICEL